MPWWAHALLGALTGAVGFLAGVLTVVGTVRRALGKADRPDR